MNSLPPVLKEGSLGHLINSAPLLPNRLHTKLVWLRLLSLPQCSLSSLSCSSSVKTAQPTTGFKINFRLRRNKSAIMNQFLSVALLLYFSDIRGLVKIYLYAYSRYPILLIITHQSPHLFITSIYNKENMKASAKTK